MHACSQIPGCGHEGKAPRSLGIMVRHYIKFKRRCAQRELDSFSAQPYESALERAAFAKHLDGKRFGHQRRLRKPALRKAAKELMRAAKKLRRSKSFDQLHNEVIEYLEGVRGLGELYYYDTSLRVGAWLHLMPRCVYLHRGTRDGARALGLDWKADSLSPETFPKPFRVLEPREIEDFLCIYKKWFRLGMQ
jgi:hypothetical protein